MRNAIQTFMAYLTLSLFVYPFFLASPAGGAELTLDDLFSRWRRRETQFRTVHIAWTETVTRPKGTLPAHPFALLKRANDEKPSRPNPPEDTTYDRARTLDIDARMVRTMTDGLDYVDGLAQYAPRQCISVYDGRDSKSFYSSSPGFAVNDVYPLGFVDGAKQHPDVVNGGALLPLLLTYRPVDPTMTRFRKPNCSISAQTAMIEGGPCTILTQNSSTEKLEFWIDPRSDCVIRRVVRTVKGKHTGQIDISYVRDSTYGWIPSGWHTVLSTDSLMAVVTESSINGSRDSTQFQLDFPPGTLVNDFKHGARYIARENGQKRIITSSESARNPSYEQLLASDSGMAGLAGRSTGFLGNWLPLVSTICVGLLAVWVGWRKIRGQSSSG